MAFAGAEQVLDLHQDFYPLPVVEQAVEAFSPVAACSVEPHGPYRRVRLQARGGRDGALLRLELANWALAASALHRG